MRNNNDIIPANKIGMTTVWIKQGFGGLAEPKSKDEQPDYTVDESEIELFGKFKDAVTELNCLNECEGFISGFRLSVRLIVEALHTEE